MSWLSKNIIVSVLPHGNAKRLKALKAPAFTLYFFHLRLATYCSWSERIPHTQLKMSVDISTLRKSILNKIRNYMKNSVDLLWMSSFQNGVSFYFCILHILLFISFICILGIIVVEQMKFWAKEVLTTVH